MQTKSETATASAGRQLRAIRTQLDRIEATLAAKGPAAETRVLGLEETAERINRGPDALRHWLKNEDLGKRQKVDLLLFRAGGRWVSTPARIEEWLRAFALEAFRTPSDL